MQTLILVQKINYKSQFFSYDFSNYILLYRSTFFNVTSSLSTLRLHLDCVLINRYVIEDDKILIQIDDGADAIQIRDFLVKQDNCLEVTVDSKSYDGAGKKVCYYCLLLPVLSMTCRFM